MLIPFIFIVYIFLGRQLSDNRSTDVGQLFDYCQTADRQLSAKK